jgi:hypothetical protein
MRTRNKIISIIKSNKPNDSIKLIQKQLEDYPDDFLTIKKLILSISKDIHKRKNIKSFTKNDAANLINSSVFDFDKKMLSLFKNMTHSELKKELLDIFKKITVNQTPTFKDKYPNMLSSCQNINLPYCKNKKLMIKKDKLISLIDVMASDILNPIKSKYMFNRAFIVNITDNFNFTFRENEQITIEI